MAKESSWIITRHLLSFILLVWFSILYSLKSPIHLFIQCHVQFLNLFLYQLFLLLFMFICAQYVCAYIPIFKCVTICLYTYPLSFFYFILWSRVSPSQTKTYLHFLSWYILLWVSQFCLSRLELQVVQQAHPVSTRCSDDLTSPSLIWINCLIIHADSMFFFYKQPACWNSPYLILINISFLFLIFKLNFVL